MRCKRHTGMPQEFLKHAIPDYVVSGTDLSFRLSNTKKSDNSQHSHCCLVWMNQNYTHLFLSNQQKAHFLVCCRTVVVTLRVPWHEKGWESLTWRTTLVVTGKPPSFDVSSLHPFLENPVLLSGWLHPPASFSRMVFTPISITALSTPVLFLRIPKVKKHAFYSPCTFHIV